jgi:hypothetical protein
MILIVSLSGCIGDAPKPPVEPECSIVAVEGVDTYLYCINSDGSGTEWRVKIKDANKYICTTPEGFVAAKNYKKELTRWMDQHCQP